MTTALHETAVLETSGLTVAYPGHRAVLRDVDLEVAPGERVLLLGPSGSGKSTLLRVLAGVVPQLVDADVAGRVLVGGRDTTATSPADLARDVGTLGQDPADQLCLPTVADEVAFPLENRAWPVAAIDAAVDRALARVGAAHLRHRRTADLSGGEGQRVALAATLVADPRLLLLDEPTALLDPAAARAVGRLLHVDGAAQVLVEHRLDEVVDLPPRTLVLGADGRLVVDGPTREVLHDEAAHLATLGVRLPGASLEPPPARAVPAGAPALSARGLAVRRGGREVLRGVDLDVRPGRVTAVVGLNGSGKSTLLLALAGLLPHAGTVTGGSVGVVFQRPEQQFLTRRVHDEVAWGPRRAGRRAGRRGVRRPGPGRRGAGGAGAGVRDPDAVAADALAAVHLAHLADRDPFRLSGGQQRRLSVAAAAVCGHDVLLADEPTFGQDARTGGATAALLRSLADEGRGLVVVTHDLALVAAVADEVVVLRDGRVLAHAPTHALLGPDADPRVMVAAGLVEGTRLRAAGHRVPA
ncbi:ATP-binding cassette domain-containing protein [Cellulomonas sp. DKR-3]|uniref:ATP-binding cassette domain-containing protein n=1 Tax=Cellulomonas fulva TaxID=2835530 RepID=A0ABS5TZY3_9CELL|nr:ABC transporter ATP-binding protein [Cellulomonas fulva]MBT0994712.1 ATP-binding cassette domain-containing protein [Cellulomonas fulva]